MIYRKGSFEQRVREMSPAEVIMAMVKGLRNPRVKVEMGSYGMIHKKDETDPDEKPVCFGCAATNAVCEIANVTFQPKNIDSHVKRAWAINCHHEFLQAFEYAINFLRMGDVLGYNMKAREIDLPEIVGINDYLPPLMNDYKPEDLDWYEKLAADQPSKEQK